MDGPIRNLKLSGHVGFDSLPDQLVNKSVQNGFIFNILSIGKLMKKLYFIASQLVVLSIHVSIKTSVIGETGLGKSTLMDSLFNTSFESSPSPHSLPSVKLKAHTYELQESNVRLKVSFSVYFTNCFYIYTFFDLKLNLIILFQLTIVDTVGYGDQINKEDSFKAVVDYIDAQFESYLQEELKIKRSLATFHDTRIHVCLYFICPTGHGYVLHPVYLCGFPNCINILLMSVLFV